MNCLLYARVSTEEQAQKGYSLDAQEKFCRDFAQNNGYKIVGVYRDEGKSGKTLDRPALKDALSKCQQDKSVDTLIIQETDRLARNTKDHLTVKALLQKAGVKIISVAQPMLDDSPEGKMIDTILASINQFQSDINSRKTKKGLQEKFNQGWWPSRALLGYKNVTINTVEEKDRKIVKKDPEKWGILKEGFRLYLSGNYSVDELNDILYRKGLRSMTGKKVPHSVMTNILKNPFYAGLMRWDGQENIGKHEHMISMNEHKCILDVMDAHNLYRCRKRKYSFLLRGFVICNICGQRYTAETHPKKKKEYYHCTARKKKHSNRGQNIEVQELERLIGEQFKRIQFDKDFIKIMLERLRKIYHQQKDNIESKKQVLYNQKKSIEAKRDKAEEKLLNEIINEEDFVRLRDKFKQELNMIQGQIYELDSQREYDIRIIQEFIKLTRNIYKAYKTAPYELKRHYLGLFWDKFLVQDKKIVEAIPTKLVQVLLKEEKVIIRGVRGQYPKDIITLLEDVNYMITLSEKIDLINKMRRTNTNPC